MNYLFVDTAGWVAAADGSDSLHRAACISRDNWLENEGWLLTTDYVIDETLTTLRIRLNLDAAEAWWEQVSTSSLLRTERIDDSRAEKARAIFFRYRDKDFSFTDFSSFVVMKEMKIRKALTLDRHFEQMGFEIFP